MTCCRILSVLITEPWSLRCQVAASNYTVPLTNTNSLQVTNLSATIEMDSGATFADNFLIDNRNTWCAGHVFLCLQVL